MRNLLKLKVVILAVSAGIVSAQDYPIANKPMRIVTTGVGSASDFASRLVAQGLSTAFGRQVIVDNSTASVAPGQIVSQSQPDGHALLVNGGVFWIRPLMLEDIPYDPIKEFSMVTTLTRACQRG